jgi:hypothetical protein
MGLTINGIKMIQFPIVTQHHGFSSRKINMNNSDIQIDVVQNFSRFNSIRKHFRIYFGVTNNMSTCKNNLITMNNISENEQFHH